MNIDTAPIEDDTHIDAYAVAMRLGLAAAFASIPLALVARSSSPDLTQVPILASDARWFYVLTLAASVALGVLAQYSDHDARWARQNAVLVGYRWVADQGRSTAWIMPTLTSLAVLLLVARFHSWPVVLIAPVLAGSGVFVGALARHYAFDADAETRRSSRISLLASAHLTAFVLLSLVFAYRLRSLVSAPAIALSVALLLLVTTDALDDSLRHRLVMAIAGGAVMAEATWALNYWNAPGWYGGIVLWALSFALASLVAARITERLTPAVVARLAGFAILIVVGVAFIAGQPG